ncbi:MAG: hypothetical protein KDI79_07830 [Anaerolineae bacterium]|nr:hypothetical protein [Anaerolineae bacterium]
MSSETWLTSLREIFDYLENDGSFDFRKLLPEAGMPDPPTIPADTIKKFQKQLISKKFHADIVESFANWSQTEQIETVKTYYLLTHQTDLSREARRQLYSTMAKSYRTFFSWQEVSHPGWTFRPGGG